MRKSEIIESLQFIAICVVGIALCMLGLKALDTHEKNRALDRCYPNEIVEHYTNQGDSYYTCKVEK